MGAWRTYAFASILALWSLPGLAIQINDETAARNVRFASGYTFSISGTLTGTPVPNSGPSFIGLGYDWSGVGWVGNSYGNTSLTLITPRQLLMANHYKQSGNIQFLSASGQVTTAVVQYANWQNAGAPTDLATATLDAPLPQSAGVATASILFQGYNPNTYIGDSLLNYGQTAAIGWNKINNIYNGLSIGNTGDTSYYSEYQADTTTPDRTLLQNGDSGSPGYVVTGSPGVIYLVGANYAVGTEGSSNASFNTFLPMELPFLDGDTMPSGYLPSVVTPTTARWTAASSGSNSNTWSASTSGNWTLASSASVFNDVLSGGTVMTCASVLFDGLASSQHSITLSGTQALGVTSLVFNLTPSTTGGFTFSGGSLTLGEAGLTNNDIHTQTFNNALVLRASQQWNAGPGGLAITSSGSLNLGAGQLLYLTGAGKSDFEGVISGSSGIAKDGSGTLILGNSNNSFSGQIFVHNGTLQFSSIQNVGVNSALGAPANSTLGTIYLAGTLAYVGNGNSSNRIIDIADGPNVVGSSGVIDASGAGSLTLTGGVICESAYDAVPSNDTPYFGASTLTLQGSGGGFLTGAITGGGTSNILSLVKSGSGTWNLSGSNTFSGTTTVNGGLLTVSGAAGSINQSAGLTLSRGTLQLDDSALTNNFSSSRLGSQPIAMQGGSLQLNFGSVSGGTETVGRVTAVMGENTLALSANGGSGLLSGGSLTRMPGAILNLTGTMASGSNGMAFGGMPSGSNFIDAGTFVNGANYAVYDAGGFMRAMVIGTNAWDYATTVAAGRHVLLTSTANAQPSISVSTLSLSGASAGFALNSAQTLTISAGGILKTGGGTGTISGGTGISALGEYVLRTDTVSDQLTITTPLTGGTAMTKSGLGTLVLGASDSYGGTTTIDAGILKTTVVGAIPATSPLVIAGGATLDLGGQSQTVAGITFYDGAVMNSAAAASLTLGGSAAGVTYAGVGSGSSISAGTLNLASIGSGGSHTFSIARGQGSSNVSGADLNILANIGDGSGSGQMLVKTGSGILQLSGTGSYTGGTQIQAGTLALGSNNAIPASSTLTLTTGTLNLGGFANSTGTLAMQSGLITGNGSFGAALFSLQGGTAAGSLVGAGSLSMSTSGVATLSGSNSYSGGTTLSGGTLVVSADNNLGAASGGLLLNGGTLQVLGTSFTTTTRPVAMTSNGGAINVADPNNTLTLATQNISGNGAFTKAGQGTLQLGGSLSSPAITVQDGTLQLTGAASQLVNAPSLNIWNIATLSFSNHNETLSTINMTGGTINSGTGTLNLTGGLTNVQTIWPATIAGNLALANTAESFSISAGAGGGLSITANISGSGGLLESGGGTLTLSGSNSFGGGTSVNQSSLYVQTDSNLGSGSILLSAGLLDLAGSVAFSSNKGVDLSSSGTIQVDNSAGATLAGPVFDSGQLTKAGTGTLILAGSNSYGGGTVISSGGLQVGNGGTFGSLGSGPIANNGTWLNFNLSSNYTVPGVISGSGILTQLGLGTVALTASNSYTGHTTINGGALQAISGIGLPSNSMLILNNGVLESSGTFARTIGSLGTNVQWSSAGGGFAANGGVLTVNLNSGGMLMWGTSVNNVRGTLLFGAATANNETNFVNPINLNGATRTISVTAGAGGDFAEISGALSNSSTASAGLTKSGNGLLVLAGANIYNGTTTISAGKLQIGAGGNAGTLGIGPVVDNSSLLFSRSDSITISDAISGSGSVTQSGSGKATLTASNTYSGGTSLAGGTLAVSSSANLGTGGLTFSGSGATLDLTGSISFTASNTVTLNQSGAIQDDDSAPATLMGLISGPGTLTKSGSGLLALSGTNTYTGGTTISSGTLQLLTPGSLPNGGLIVGANATLIFGNTLTGSPVMEASALMLDDGGIDASSFEPSGSDLAISALSSNSSQSASQAAANASQSSVNTVPEPNTLLSLLAAAVAGLFWHVRRRFQFSQTASE